jgi:hypothetical protein
MSDDDETETKRYKTVSETEPTTSIMFLPLLATTRNTFSYTLSLPVRRKVTFGDSVSVDTESDEVEDKSGENSSALRTTMFRQAPKVCS